MSTTTPDSEEALTAVSALAHEPTDERMVPESAGGATFWEHLFRYRFVRPFVRSKRVLDVACGEGYGLAALAGSGASFAMGVDISPTACRHAVQRYGVRAVVGSAEELPMAGESVDVVVSFETLEHVPHPERFVAEAARVLRPGGVFIVSTPNLDTYAQVADPNPYHCSEMSEQDFVRLINTRFARLELYGQHPLTAPWWSLRAVAAERTAWGRIRGFGRLRALLQAVASPQTTKRPDSSVRAKAVEWIRSSKPTVGETFSPFAITRTGNWFNHRPLFLVGVAYKAGAAAAESN